MQSEDVSLLKSNDFYLELIQLFKDFNLTQHPIENSEHAITISEGRRVAVIYVTEDLYPPATFWSADKEKGFLHNFGISAIDRRRKNELLKKLTPTPPLCYVDGVVKIHETDSQSAETLYEMPGALADALSRGVMDWETALKEIQKIFDDFNAWRSGELCGVATDIFHVDTTNKTLKLHDHAVTWPRACLARALKIRDAKLEELREPTISTGYAPFV